MNLVRLLSRLHVALLRLGIGRRFRGNRVVVLTTRGRRTGKRRPTPLLAFEDGERLVLIASFGGAPENPYWFRNLTADPHVEVDGRPYRARVATDEERDRLWPRVVERYPGYGRYQAKTSRTIPLVVLAQD
jgi:deazaflavin-dependent oxidoreductase (nitroreductase family)